jgi:hypothetical protein
LKFSSWLLLSSGYFCNPKATKDTFNSDGWFMTGDIGRVDDEGFFHVVDRKKELIKYHGVQGDASNPPVVRLPREYPLFRISPALYTWRDGLSFSL